jgi:hypothetical protein
MTSDARRPMRRRRVAPTIGDRGGSDPQGGAPLNCSCGRTHDDASSLVKLGWRALGFGDFAMLANCRCGSTLTVSRLTDASQCTACRRVVTGTDGDVKVCFIEGRDAVLVCVACFRRHARRAERVERIVAPALDVTAIA